MCLVYGFVALSPERSLWDTLRVICWVIQSVLELNCTVSKPNTVRLTVLFITYIITYISTKTNSSAVLMVVKWSVGLPSILTIRGRILLRSLIFLGKNLFKG